MSNIDPTKYREWTQVLRKGKEMLLHMLRPSCLRMIMVKYQEISYSMHKGWEEITTIQTDSKCSSHCTLRNDQPIHEGDHETRSKYNGSLFKQIDHQNQFPIQKIKTLVAGPGISYLFRYMIFACSCKWMECLQYESWIHFVCRIHLWSQLDLIVNC